MYFQSRKKDQLNNQLEKGIVSNRNDKSISSLLHETPPSSAESYKHYSEVMSLQVYTDISYFIISSLF